MSKMLDATSDATGKVTAEGVVVVGATVLSEGKQSSNGLLLIDEDRVRYIPSSATDIKTTIEKLIAVLDSLSPALTKVGTTLTAIGAGMTGPTTAPPPTLAVDVADINAKIASIDSVKVELQSLKGALI